MQNSSAWATSMPNWKALSSRIPEPQARIWSGSQLELEPMQAGALSTRSGFVNAQKAHPEHMDRASREASEQMMAMEKQASHQI